MLIKKSKVADYANLLGAFLLATSVPNLAHGQEISGSLAPSYADLVDLSDPSEIVLKAQIRKQATVELERSPGLAAGFVRLYIEARTEALISGNVPVGETLRYLVDVPVDEKGRAPKIRKRDVLIFGRTIPGRAGDIQLVGPSSQLFWTPELEGRLRPILSDLVANGSPPVVDGIRDALSIDGNLVGESETQIFLSTNDGAPVSISVIRRPGQDPVWGVSWSEIVDQAAKPPVTNTLEWYRLACFLPRSIQDNAIIAGGDESRRRTQED